MHRLIFILLILMSCTSKSNNQTNKADGTIKIHDTVFISRGIKKDNYCAVYIEKNRQAGCYNDLLSFRMDSDERVEYKQNYQAIKDQNPAPYKVCNLSGLPKEWVPLYQHKNKYYIYYPSDAGNMARAIITDSTLNYWYMDGIYPEPFKSVKKINSQTWGFKIHQNYPDTGFRTITIHIIDPKNKIAVWEDSSESKNSRYKLYVPKENARNFDMVVNFCRNTKTAEFMFDAPDYKSLLKGH